MPLSQSPIVEWPTELQHLLHGIQVASGAAGKRYSRIEIDVDPETLLLLNEFEARVRHRQVRLRETGSAECLLGEMNVLVGLGAAANPNQHVGKVRISFHNIQDDNCTDTDKQAR
jgi:hypothetical protein